MARDICRELRRACMLTKLSTTHHAGDDNWTWPSRKTVPALDGLHARCMASPHAGPTRFPLRGCFAQVARHMLPALFIPHHYHTTRAIFSTGRGGCFMRAAHWRCLARQAPALPLPLDQHRRSCRAPAGRAATPLLPPVPFNPYQHGWDAVWTTRTYVSARHGGTSRTTPIFLFHATAARARCHSAPSQLGDIPRLSCSRTLDALRFFRLRLPVYQRALLLDMTASLGVVPIQPRFLRSMVG